MDGAHTHGSSGGGRLGGIGLVSAVLAGGGLYELAKHHGTAKEPAPAPKPAVVTKTVVEHASPWPTVIATVSVLVVLAAIVAVFLAWRRNRAPKAVQPPQGALGAPLPQQVLRRAAYEALAARTVKAHLTAGEPIRRERA